MDYYNFESFDITHLVEQYSGIKLEELFKNQRIISNSMGQFLELFWEEDDFLSDLDLLVTKRKALSNLKTVYSIGENIEKNLLRRGVKTLNDLKVYKRYRKSANEIIRLIKTKDYVSLCKNKYIYDMDVSFCFKLKDLLFLDIETLGLYDSPVIIVGIGFFKNKKLYIREFFARDLEEEIAIFEHLRTKILPNFKSFITYNGKSFDIPYIANRFLYYFDENPMISDDDVPYEKNNTKYHHIDLYHDCRRKYKGMFDKYTLTDMEEKLLKWKRDNELPSSLVGMCYKKYMDDPQRYIGLIKECIEHNYFDVYSMPLILKQLLNKR
ncbi:MAG: ribonuclease H-like domain-containing protein [Promethearchaeota archaeon]